MAPSPTMMWSLSNMSLMWQTIYGDQAGYLCVASGERPKPGDQKLLGFRERFFEWPSEASEAVAWCRKASDAGREVYQCSHLLTKQRRLKGNAVPLVSCWADGDGAHVPADILQPSVIVESSPGREQLYWLLDREVSPEVGEVLNRRIALTMGADLSGWDLSQLLRPPGTRNYKYPDAPMVVLRELTAVRHDPRELDEALPPLPRVAPRAPTVRPPQNVFIDLPDEELVRRASRAKGGERFVALWSGDTSAYQYTNADGTTNEGRNEADLALAGRLVFWTGGDLARADRLFRASGLMREKWDEVHYATGETYGEHTLHKGLSDMQEFYRHPGGSAIVYARKTKKIEVAG